METQEEGRDCQIRRTGASTQHIRTVGTHPTPPQPSELTGWKDRLQDLECSNYSVENLGRQMAIGTKETSGACEGHGLRRRWNWQEDSTGQGKRRGDSVRRTQDELISWQYGDMGAPDPYDPTFDYYEAVRKSLTIDGKKWMVEANDFHWRDDWVAGFVHWVRAMDCYVLVYSSTSRDSFYSLRMWSAKIRAIQDMSDASLVRQREPAILVAVVATKCDLRDARAVSTAEGIDLARELGCPFYETSRVARNEIDRVWEAIGRTWWNGTIAKDPQGARPTAACKAGECERESSRRWSMHRRLRSFHRRLVGSSEQ